LARWPALGVLSEILFRPVAKAMLGLDVVPLELQIVAAVGDKDAQLSSVIGGYDPAAGWIDRQVHRRMPAFGGKADMTKEVRQEDAAGAATIVCVCSTLSYTDT
jgi:hypothetical protein